MFATFRRPQPDTALLKYHYLRSLEECFLGVRFLIVLLPAVTNEVHWCVSMNLKFLLCSDSSNIIVYCFTNKPQHAAYDLARATKYRTGGVASDIGESSVQRSASTDATKSPENTSGFQRRYNWERPRISVSDSVLTGVSRKQ